MRLVVVWEKGGENWHIHMQGYTVRIIKCELRTMLHLVNKVLENIFSKYHSSQHEVTTGVASSFPFDFLFVEFIFLLLLFGY